MESSPTSIIVEDLPMDFNSRETIITEDFLCNLFNELGNIIIEEIEIYNRESRKKIPYAYAFVEFKTRKMAERAIKELNYTKLENVPIRLSFADPETSKIRKSDAGKLLIKGFPPGIEVSHLHDLFANFGEIITCNIPRYYNQNDGTYHSRCYGIVQFRNPKDAEQACSDLNGALINGVKVTIEPFQRVPTEETFTKVYIKGLPDSIRTKEDLEAFVSPFGEIQSVSLPLDEDQNPKGYGFCNMMKHKDAVSMVKLLNGKEIKGKKLECTRCLSEHELIKKRKSERKSQRESHRYLYVRGFGNSATKEELLQIFKKFGKIESFKIKRNKEGQSRGFGFILFENQEDAENFIRKSCGLTFKEKQIYVAVSMPKYERISRQNQNKKVVSKNQHQAPKMQPVSALQYQQQNQMQSIQNKKDFLRLVISERYGNPNAEPYLKRLKDLSDDQINAIYASLNLLERFYHPNEINL